MDMITDGGEESDSCYTQITQPETEEAHYDTKFDIMIQNGELMRHLVDMFKKFMADYLVLSFDRKGIVAVQMGAENGSVFHLKLRGKAMIKYDFDGKPVCLSISIPSFLKAMTPSRKKNWLRLEYAGTVNSSIHELIVTIMNESSMFDMSQKSLLTVEPCLMPKLSSDYSDDVTQLCRIQKDQFASMCKRAKDTQEMRIQIQPPHFLRVTGRVDYTLGMRCEKGEILPDKDIFSGNIDAESLKNIEKLSSLCHYFISIGYKEGTDNIIIETLIGALGSMRIYMRTRQDQTPASAFV